jgi:hypothetical protein
MLAPPSRATNPSASQSGVEPPSAPVTGNSLGSISVGVTSGALVGAAPVAVAVVPGIAPPVPAAPSPPVSAVAVPSAGGAPGVPPSIVVGVPSSPVTVVAVPLTPGVRVGPRVPMAAGVPPPMPGVPPPMPGVPPPTPGVPPPVPSAGGRPGVPPPVPPGVSLVTTGVSPAVSVGAAAWKVAVCVGLAAGVSRTSVGVGDTGVAVRVARTTAVGEGAVSSASEKVAHVPRKRRNSNAMRTRRFFFLICWSSRSPSNTTTPVAPSRGLVQSRLRC